MRAAIIAALCLLAACGKKEEYEPPRIPFGCHDVTILRVTETHSLMEEDKEGRPRFLREGIFGSVGDKFRYCE